MTRQTAIAEQPLAQGRPNTKGAWHIQPNSLASIYYNELLILRQQPFLGESVMKSRYLLLQSLHFVTCKLSAMYIQNKLTVIFVAALGHTI